MKVVVPHRNDKLHEAGLMSLPCSQNLHKRNLKSVDYLSGTHDKRIVVEIHLYPHPLHSNQMEDLDILSAQADKVGIL